MKLILNKNNKKSMICNKNYLIKIKNLIIFNNNYRSFLIKKTKNIKKLLMIYNKLYIIKMMN